MAQHVIHPNGRKKIIIMNELNVYLFIVNLLLKTVVRRFIRENPLLHQW
ncbi:hypothetical protein BBEV_2071 [Salisediminibacterium beveridgei]|uniref:Uncharacterized protein n=1 Tax=Salisediminibacterium beveridgei TaxID=632773 RepID=A0A1D7QWS7_9BACI|nr:hypothetical protein BBEV_2071 [Salisediminibacterium beveridgei]